ncbi:uncharacterized protein METZ01_LOCUS60601 [marine metagenome]|uniref:Uncharacterized protein n=1 Tax=marine metagenome TaxID=408172 RepID=A0A381SZA0_9ZZZZ
MGKFAPRQTFVVIGTHDHSMLRLVGPFDDDLIRIGTDHRHTNQSHHSS